jgi:type II secretory pathway predicted ATPase ExeA
MPDTIFSFFGLRENPFKINPDPRFLFLTEQARATAEELTYGIRTRKGLILLTGEVGTGKTMQLRRLLDWLAEQKMPTALIFNSRIKPDHLLDFILNDLRIPCSSSLKSDKLLALNRWLLDRYRAGHTPVLIVDEAQGLEPSALEEIRLLLHFETHRDKLLQIILAGQPELEIKLKRHELRQLRQRITIRCRTAPLTLEQTRGYIFERLRVAGASNDTIFEPDAIAAVQAFSHGIPRVINVLCEHSLINACADGSRTISSSVVEQAARECQLDRAESIARILSTGSYPTTSLSDIGSILAAVSASSDSSPRPASQPEVIPPAAPPVQSTTPPAFASLQPRSSTPLAPAPPQARWPQASPQEVSLAATPSPSPAFAARPSVPPMKPQPAQPQPFVRRPFSLVDLLRGWSRSFASDVRASSRRVQRLFRESETRYWQPFVREMRRGLKNLQSRASRLPSHPRWIRTRSRIVATSRDFWRIICSSMPAPLARFLGVRPQHTNAQTRAAAPRPTRRRAISSLHRWLHAPLSDTRSREAGSRHHGLN